MWIALIVLFWICTLIGFFILGNRITRKQCEDEKIRLINDARLDEDLNDIERTKIKEWRLIRAKVSFCIDCGRVSGIKYQSEDGNPRGITLKRVGVTKEGSSICRCLTCCKIDEEKEETKKT